MREPNSRLDSLKLMGGSALAVSCRAPAAWASTALPSLDNLARAKGRRFGSVIASGDCLGGTVANGGYAQIVTSECSRLVAENEMKWQALHIAKGEFAFDRADRIAVWAQSEGLTLRGHALLWHRARWLPDWVNDFDYGAHPARAAEALLVDHINAVIGRYGSVVASWDVVNEAVNDAADGYEETSLSRALGSVEQVLDVSFHAAGNATPKALLVYNVYMSWEPEYAGHRKMVLHLLEVFRKRDTPVDALGVQSHIQISRLDPHTGLGPYEEKAWRSFMDAVVGMGYRVIITEFNVRDSALPTDLEVRDAKVADYARRYLDVMLSYPQLGDIMAWGKVDRYNWLQNFAPRQDGLAVRGCPYGSDHKAKPLRTAIATAPMGAKQAS